MLPDFPCLKRDIAMRLIRAAQSLAQGGSLLRDIPAFRQHEGDRTNMIRADGSVGTITYESPLSAEAEIRIDDARREGPGASIRAIREMSEQLAEGITKRMIETITEAVEEVGNVIDGKGRPFSADMMIEMLETMDLSFDDRGEWQPPTMVLHPEMTQKVRGQLEALEQDPTVKQRIDAVVNRKREEWRARETCRALVD